MLGLDRCCTWHVLVVPAGHWEAGRVSWLIMVYRLSPEGFSTGGKFLTDASCPLWLQVTLKGCDGKKPLTRQPMTTFLASSTLRRLSGKRLGLVGLAATQDTP